MENPIYSLSFSIFFFVFLEQPVKKGGKEEREKKLTEMEENVGRRR